MQSSQRYASVPSALQEDDVGEEYINGEERQCFRHNVEALAIARKLSLVSEWSSRYSGTQGGIGKNGNVFVADRRLWNGSVAVWKLTVRTTKPI